MPILTTLEELYKFGPGPSSSHTMGPMIAGYNFYKLACQLSLEELSRATELKIELLGSLSATGKGHGTDRAVLAGVLGKTPDNCDPRFLDELAQERCKKHALDIKSFHANLSVDDVVYGPTVGKFPHPNTMRFAAFRNGELLECVRAFSIGGGSVRFETDSPDEEAEFYPEKNLA
ncbi:L-serine ammonia-lyase, partial [bacterium]|nr:L-serine ammonia-lyase [bacterium]